MYIKIIITLTSSLCSTLSPANTLLAVAFIVIYPSSFGIIMNDTLEPELAFTYTVFLRYGSNSEKERNTNQFLSILIELLEFILSFDGN